MNSEEIDAIRRALVAWYARGHRELPWRKTRDPYAVWVSEIMCQQTRVDTATPYYNKWMVRFPSVRALAEAPLDDVLAHWSGLGYYARARNLHAAAREITARYGGNFPGEPEAVRALPGVGRYTAGAILSIAFDRAEPILDGNVARVLSRLCCVEDQKTLWSIAAQLVPQRSPGDFNQALMELGATVCTPRAPACLTCPIAKQCAARREGRQEELPRAKKKTPTRIIEQVTVLVEKPGQILLCKRPAAGLWGGLWEPPTGARLRGEEAQQAAARIVREACGLTAIAPRPIETFEHVLSHRRVRFAAFAARSRGRIRAGGSYESARWVRNVDEVGIAAWAKRLMKELA